MTELYKTSDIILAACLKLNGFTMRSIERTGRKGIFVFEDIEQDFITEYDLGNVKVEPVAFNNQIKALTTSVRRMTQD